MPSPTFLVRGACWPMANQGALPLPLEPVNNSTRRHRWERFTSTCGVNGWCRGGWGEEVVEGGGVGGVGGEEVRGEGGGGWWWVGVKGGVEDWCGGWRVVWVEGGGKERGRDGKCVRAVGW